MKNKTVQAGSKKKIAKKVIIAVLLVLLIGASVLCYFYFSSNFRANKLNKISIGANAETVLDKLGEPDMKTNNIWEYYGKSYKNLQKKAEDLVDKMKNVDSNEELEKLLQESEKISSQMANLSFKYIKINFSSNDVVSILYDAHHTISQDTISSEVKKMKLSFSQDSYSTQKTFSLANGSETITKTAYPRVTNIESSIYFKDGSFYKDSIYNATLEIVDEAARMKWKNEYGEFESEIDIPIEKTSDGLTIKTIFSCPNIEMLSIESTVPLSIGTDAFWGCRNLSKISLPQSLISLGRMCFANCHDLSITYEGTTEQWNNIEKVVYKSEYKNGLYGPKGYHYFYWNNDSSSIIHCSNGDI